MNLNYFEIQTPIIQSLGLSEEALPLVKSYIDLLWTANEELNLISRKMTINELIDNHVIDCLLPLKFFPRDINDAADFGSGGGLPGILYAIQFPKIQFYLFEKSPKKQSFLNSCKTLCPNISVHGEIPAKLDKVELIMARGFKPLDVILELSRQHYKNGGKYFLLKGRKEKIMEEITLAKKKQKDFSPTIEPLTSPVLQVERHLVRF